MKSDRLLEIDVSLLLLRHGKRAVLRQIAESIEVSVEDVEKELGELRASKEKLEKRKKSLPIFDLEKIASGNEGKLDLLKKLEAKFENRTFLPELKDVNRLMGRHSAHATKAKSRLLAKQKIFSLLAQLRREELEDMLSSSRESKDVSSLGLISDQILGKPRT